MIRRLTKGKVEPDSRLTAQRIHSPLAFIHLPSFALTGIYSCSIQLKKRPFSSIATHTYTIRADPTAPKITFLHRSSPPSQLGTIQHEQKYTDHPPDRITGQRSFHSQLSGRQTCCGTDVGRPASSCCLTSLPSVICIDRIRSYLRISVKPRSAFSLVFVVFTDRDR